MASHGTSGKRLQEVKEELEVQKEQSVLFESVELEPLEAEIERLKLEVAGEVSSGELISKGEKWEGGGK